VGSRVDPGGLDAAWTTDGGRTWRSVGLSRAQNPEGSFVGVGALAAATDASGALHLAWLQGRTGRERLLFTRIPNPMAPEESRD
jgi:hypothetical protein